MTLGISRLRAFVSDDRGQDIIEYGLLAGIIGIAGILVIPAIEARMPTLFSNWGRDVNNLWIPNPPAA